LLETYKKINIVLEWRTIVLKKGLKHILSSMMMRREMLNWVYSAN